ncbi:hypothetical protein [Adhaeribacter soli]|uniref:DUF4468 domain-containing protein n=1 Tax=Adhaeribacter soli TaxID=2607655 RepID=A0A5N1IKD8_9BACT|nr:hypothetical protein [Adhaeribacter soli]KAA9325988.1 hypothetical protein F0P94_16345 [Adhaeribacter soli]
MKKITSIVLLFSFLMTSCKAWDPSMLSVKKEPITPKLLTLERRMEDMANTTVVSSGDELKIFTQEVEANLMDPYGDKYGYIALKRNVVELKSGALYPIVSGLFLFAPNLFGFPMGKFNLKLEVELRILDKNNKLIGKYSAIGESNTTMALYYGYGMTSAGRKIYPDALNDALNKIRPQIQADASRVNAKLKEAGILQ